MIEKPPSDPADHAEDFCRRYAAELDYHSGRTMLDIGIPRAQIGARDTTDGLRHKCFFPHERTVGGLNYAGHINLDSGVMDPTAMDGPYGEDAGDYWRSLRLRDRMQAAIAHEYEEHLGGGHEEALDQAPRTDLAISDRAREMCRKMRDGWRR